MQRRSGIRGKAPRVRPLVSPQRLTKSDLLRIACSVIDKSNRINPADRVLRLELARQAGLDPLAARFVTEAVFRYYRWCRWLSSRKPLPEQLSVAYETQQRFDSAPSTFSDAELLNNSIPDWVAAEVSVSPEWVRALQNNPLLWLRAKIGEEKLVATVLGNCRAVDKLPTALSYAGSDDLFCSTEFQAGSFELQDLSSQIVGHVCSPEPNQTWWDACAGEGGKTLHLSDLMRNKGLIWASDRAGWRLQTLKRRAARAKAFNYRVVPWNGGSKLPTRTKFDGVLVDAPCSGIGTWHRNPHARWTTSDQDVLDLKRLQKELLLNSAPAVKAGGKLIYSVCTLARSETVEVTKEVSDRLGDFVPLALRYPVTGVESSQLWIWPQEFGGNGMFIAGWQRKA